MSRTSRTPDAVVAKSLVRKRLKLRNRMLTFGEWMWGWGCYVDKEKDDDGVIHQIVVLHEDEYMRTYTVNQKEFKVIKDPETYDESVNALFKGTECMIDTTTTITEDQVRKMMKARPFRGGCAKGKQMVAAKGATNMAGIRIQFWDTTQATWYAGKIFGMWKERPRTHWLVLFDDETEYAVSKTDDVWKLDRGDTLIEGSKAGGHVRLAQFAAGDKKHLEFVVETTAPMSRIHVRCWRHGVQVYQSKKRASEGADRPGNPGSSKRPRITSDRSRGTSPHADGGTISQSDMSAIPGTKLWILSSHSPLVADAMQVTHTVGVLKVTVPVE
eukprot:jgi/Ulvmu1/1264/UM109_0062.1